VNILVIGAAVGLIISFACVSIGGPVAKNAFPKLVCLSTPGSGAKQLWPLLKKDLAPPPMDSFPQAQQHVFKVRFARRHEIGFDNWKHWHKSRCWLLVMQGIM
jgi:hypothetical protein